MTEYQLQIKQMVDYPRCRIYKQFIQSLINDRDICTGKGSGLFYYMVLCSYVNFSTSHRYIDGISYTAYPGEWICTLKELSGWFRTCFQHQVIDILEDLQCRHLLSYLLLDRGKIIKYKIRNWSRHNTVLDYDCPSQKDTGYFFMPMTIAAELVSASRCSEMDAVLDLWLSAVYNDIQVQGSEAGPVVYLRNGTGCPLINNHELALRWGIPPTAACRLIKKLSAKNYISLRTLPGKTGNVIYLQGYLSSMFQISDVLLDKEEVGMAINISIWLPDKDMPLDGISMKEIPTMEHEVSISETLSCISKTQIEMILQKMAKVLEVQGISCFHCPGSSYKLFPLSADNREADSFTVTIDNGRRFGLAIFCGENRVYQFELTLSPASNKEGRM